MDRDPGIHRHRDGDSPHRPRGTRPLSGRAPHLYVHIPFCRSRCAYCDFASEPVGPHLRAGRVVDYLERVRAEVRERVGADRRGGAARNCPAYVSPETPVSMETVYLGGGTPTVLPEELLLPLVVGLVRLQEGVDDPEFTIEANPETLDRDLLERLADAGVSRVSLGVQSFAPGFRATLGRRTGQEEVETAIRALQHATGRGHRLREWNIDLVFGIPGQGWATAAADIDAAMAAGPTHISLYDLTYTSGFAARVARTAGAGARGAAAAFAEEYLGEAAARLEAGGYRRYEVSNFARPGHECRHNQAYWRGEDYVGAGVAAVSTVGRERRTNAGSVEAYLADQAPAIEIVDARTRLWEKAMLGLRTAEGVVEAEVDSVLDSAALERLSAQGCVARHCGRLRLNPAFLDVSNTVIAALLTHPEEP